MDVMEKLVELLWEYDQMRMMRMSIEECADRIMEKGVTVQDVHDTNVGEWISVKDRTPSEKGCYMVTVKHWLDGKPVVREAKWNGVDWLSCYKAEELTPRVTHWTYLPQPPKGE